MSNIALFKGGAVPAFAAARTEPSALAKALAGSAGRKGKRISIKGGFFRLMQDGKEVAQIEERYINAVIVNAAPKIGRIFYAKKWDPDTVAAPDCWSSDGEVPDAGVANPQSPNCANCDQNVKGSGANESKACRFQQALAVVPVFDDEMTEDVMNLTAPALSIFGKEENGNFPLQAYARYLAAQTPSVDPDMLVTRIRFDPKAESPKLFFKPARWLTEEEYAKAKELGQSDDAIQAVKMDVEAPAAAAPIATEGKRPTKAKPAPVDDDEDEVPAPKAKAKAKPAPVDDDEDEVPAPKAKAKAKPAPVDDDDEDEPQVKPKKTAAAPAVNPKGTLAQMAAKWDDEED